MERVGAPEESTLTGNEGAKHLFVVYLVHSVRHTMKESLDTGLNGSGTKHDLDCE